MPKIEEFLKPDERVIKEQARITAGNMAPHSGTKVKRFCTEFGTPAKPLV